MKVKLTIGSTLSYTYNSAIGKLPSRTIRIAFLKSYLASLGNKTSVQMNCRFLNGRKVYLGDRNVVNFGCLFDGRHYKIQTGNDVSIGPEATILTLGHDPQSPEFADKGGDVIIGNHVWIAYRAIILPGITIGEGAVVGAGSVVTKDIPPYTIVAGNPAKVIGHRNPNLNYQFNYRPFLM
jgi:acetyltransferase-like isoleucine patch superfamily enzyme